MAQEYEDRYFTTLPSGKRLYSITLCADGTSHYVIDGVEETSLTLDDADVKYIVIMASEFYSGVRTEWLENVDG